MIKYAYPMKVFYKDVDQMGIVYYSRYLEFFEAARTEMLSSIGLDYNKVEENGAMLPVIEAHTEYKKGATFGQEICVITTITELPKVKMTFHYKVTSTDSGEILMTGHTIHAFTNLNGKPIKTPKYIRDLLANHFNI